MILLFEKRLKKAFTVLYFALNLKKSNKNNKTYLNEYMCGRNCDINSCVHCGKRSRILIMNSLFCVVWWAEVGLWELVGFSVEEAQVDALVVRPTPIFHWWKWLNKFVLDYKYETKMQSFVRGRLNKFHLFFLGDFPSISIASGFFLWKSKIVHWPCNVWMYFGDELIWYPCQYVPVSLRYEVFLPTMKNKSTEVVL